MTDTDNNRPMDDPVWRTPTKEEAIEALNTLMDVICQRQREMQRLEDDALKQAQKAQEGG